MCYVRTVQLTSNCWTKTKNVIIDTVYERQAQLNMRDEGWTAAGVQYTPMVINLDIVFNQWKPERYFALLLL